MIVETLIVLVFLPNIYMELTNASKINAWYEAVLQEKVGGLGIESAVFKLNRHGYRIVEIVKTKDNGQRVILEPPYDQGLVSLIRVKYPFRYLLETNSNGVVISYGLLK